MGMKPIKVAQLNGYIKRVLQTDPLLGNVSVIGEISNLKFHGSGHVYFTLKDDKSKLNCFLAAENLKNIHYELADGMEITVSGYIYLYERGGSYSLNVKDIQVEGKGDLNKAFEQLKLKLLEEGLFEDRHKKELPFFPERIAVVTSRTGAAIEDVLRIIKNKNNYVDVLIYPVLVQGPNAAGEIASAIDNLNENFTDIDLIITGRGGGGIEDLWAFNEEIVARSIFASRIPVISAVGHEIDVTISDFVADKRAETPTAAASMAVPDIEALKEAIDAICLGIKDGVQENIHYKETLLDHCGLDVFKKELKTRISFEEMAIENIRSNNVAVLQEFINKKRQQIEILKINLENLNPQNIMKRGYAAITNEKGMFVTGVDKLNVGEHLQLAFADGDANCKVLEINKK
ncbi:MAG: exodeoxyribonuclease VII large subunit [Anaerovoracaceae bacterium]